MKKIMGSLFFTLIVSASLNCLAESEVENLSPELRSLLKQEMLAIQDGMTEILAAFASGDLHQVSDIAGRINKSYILKQKITDTQKHELHEKLSEDFLLKDQQFHKYAGMLEHVSDESHTELVGFYYSKLMDSCIGCHSAHAKHRFPNFTSEPEDKGHHH